MPVGTYYINHPVACKSYAHNNLSSARLFLLQMVSMLELLTFCQSVLTCSVFINITL